MSGPKRVSVTAHFKGETSLPERLVIVNDKEFWVRLEFEACGWLEAAQDKRLSAYWIDGFIPEFISNTRFGAKVEGSVWVGDPQHEYSLIANLSQSILARSDREIFIDSIHIDHRNQSLEITVRHQNEQK